MDHQMLIEKIEEKVNVHVDSLSPNAAKTLPFKAHDATSNQIIVGAEMLKPENETFVKEIVKQHKSEGWQTILDYITVSLAVNQLANIGGRVHVQVSCRHAYSTEAVIAHAQNYAEIFENMGVSLDRICIKIPSTGPALAASRILESQGIRTLATTLFNLDQAIAAYQAQCLYIAPYYNELAAHSNKDLWPNVQDPALEHPMSSRIYRIVQKYKNLQQDKNDQEDQERQRPIIMVASLISVKECLACIELGVDSETISPALLTELSNMKNENVPSYPSARLDVLKNVDVLGQSNQMNQDQEKELNSGDDFYIKDNGSNLDKAISFDSEANRRLKESLESFNTAEIASKVEIERILQGLE